jgi:prolipoprotein diacylglyceryltransferase
VSVIELSTAFLPSQPVNGFHIGPLFVDAYGLCYVIAVIAAVTITVRRWEVKGGQRDLVYEVALWGFPAGIIGGRLYFWRRAGTKYRRTGGECLRCGRAAWGYGAR